MKNMINKLKKLSNKNIDEGREELSSVVKQMKEDANRQNNKTLNQYARLIEEMFNLNSQEVLEVDEIVNLTSHKINVLDEDDDTIISIDPSGDVARVNREDKLIQIIRYKTTELDVVEHKVNGIDNLPEPEEGKIFIVSRMVAEKSNRTDLYVPDKIKHDKFGNAKGCRRLARPR